MQLMPKKNRLKPAHEPIVVQRIDCLKVSKTNGKDAKDIKKDRLVTKHGKHS